MASVSRNMAGEWEVRAANDMGEAACKCNLKVNSKRKLTCLVVPNCVVAVPKRIVAQPAKEAS
jgi:uncharacterized protein (DUF1499 family)